MHMKWQMGKRN